MIAIALDRELFFGEAATMAINDGIQTHIARGETLPHIPDQTISIEASVDADDEISPKLEGSVKCGTERLCWRAELLNVVNGVASYRIESRD